MSNVIQWSSYKDTRGVLIYGKPLKLHNVHQQMNEGVAIQLQQDELEELEKPKAPTLIKSDNTLHKEVYFPVSGYESHLIIPSQDEIDFYGGNFHLKDDEDED